MKTLRYFLLLLLIGTLAPSASDLGARAEAASRLGEKTARLRHSGWLITPYDDGDSETQPQNDTSYVASYRYAGPRPHAPTQVNETIAGRVYPRALSYDADGDQTGWVYGTATRRENDWNEEDRLQAVRGNGVELARALYDGEGQRRVSHQRGGSGGSAQETAYFSANVTLRDGRYVTKHVFLGETRIASKMEASTPNQAPTTLYFHDDSLGSTHFLTDGDQALVAHEEYFPTGELWVDEAERKFAERQAYLFNGKELDAGTGLYYYGARYYDARLSQWNSPDPVLRGYLSGMGNGGVYRPENLGLYTYTWNSPVVLKDPDGSCPLCATAGAGALIGGAISGGTRLASNYASGRPLLQGVGASMVGGAVSGALIGLTGGAGGAAVGVGTMLGEGAVAATAGGVAERAVEHGLDSAQVFDVKAMAGDAVAGAAGAGLGAGLGALSKQLGQAGRSAAAQAETRAAAAEGVVRTPIASGASRAPRRAMPDSIYEQTGPSGEVRSRTFYDENGRAFSRQDFDHPHGGMQPHEHIRSFDAAGRPITPETVRPVLDGYGTTLTTP